MSHAKLGAVTYREYIVRTVDSRCLDHVLVYRRRHLDGVLRVYVSHHAEQRPHRGLDLATPRDGSSSPARQTERVVVERLRVEERRERRHLRAGLPRFEPVAGDDDDRLLCRREERGDIYAGGNPPFRYQR